MVQSNTLRNLGGAMSLTALVLIATPNCNDVQAKPVVQQVQPPAIPLQGRVVGKLLYTEPRVVNRDTANFGNATMQVGESTLSFELQAEYQGKQYGSYYVTVHDGTVNSFDHLGEAIAKKETIKHALESNSRAIVKLENLYVAPDVNGQNSVFKAPGAVIGVGAMDMKIYK